MLWLAISTAWAGSGPWTLSKGDHSLFLGAEAQRFTQLAPVIDGELSQVDTGGPVLTTGVKLSNTLGVIDRVEVEATIPYFRSEALITSPGACTEIPNGPCATTTGFGIIELRTKWQLLDELAGSPVSLAVGARVRLGAHTQATRHRVTNLGEGTNDVGPFLAIGRAARLGQGYWNAFVEVGYLHRPPTTLDPRGPNDEISGDLLAHFAPGSTVCVGPAVSALYRPGGLEFDAIDLESADRFATLTVLNTRVGGEVVLRDPELGIALTGTFLQTVLARNNPSNTWTLGVGLSLFNPLARRKAG